MSSPLLSKKAITALVILQLISTLQMYRSAKP